MNINAPYIPSDGEGPVFSAPWEARAFAMVVRLHEAGHYTWVQWVEALSSQIAKAEHGEHAKQGHTDDYYECWLAAMEGLLKTLGLMTDEGLSAEIETTLAHWPHPDHVAKREPVARDLPGHVPARL
ncbi:nitrile hydratase accessory protein [Mesorhizobium cantuariense]|uniref:Nitrile hydratase accessory protein n=1 Tax=Mesorhizobium cantuariense TaxID=1300275 RepID=A0ABV7MQN3_9HYPH